jgi:hypothetical protein
MLFAGIRTKRKLSSKFSKAGTGAPPTKIMASSSPLLSFPKASFGASKTA